MTQDLRFTSNRALRPSVHNAPRNAGARLRGRLTEPDRPFRASESPSGDDGRGYPTDGRANALSATGPIRRRALARGSGPVRPPHLTLVRLAWHPPHGVLLRRALPRAVERRFVTAARRLGALTAGGHIRRHRLGITGAGRSTADGVRPHVGRASAGFGRVAIRARRSGWRSIGRWLRSLRCSEGACWPRSPGRRAASNASASPSVAHRVTGSDGTSPALLHVAREATMLAARRTAQLPSPSRATPSRIGAWSSERASSCSSSSAFYRNVVRSCLRRSAIQASS